MRPSLAPPPARDEALSQRNRRTAIWLLIWIALLVAASVAVIWLRNG